MSQKLTAQLPPDLHLDNNYTLRFTAVDAATGAALSTVNVSNATIIATNLLGSNLESGVFEVTEIEWLNVPVSDEGAP